MSTPQPISASQVRHVHDEGYFVAEDVLTASDLQPVIDEIAAEVDRRAEELVREGKLSRSYAEEDFEHRFGKITAETDALYWSIVSGQLCGPAFFNLICNPRLVDIAEQLCGPEVIASSVYRLRPKAPGYAHGEVPWHQDSGYTEPYCDKSLMITMWIPLVDATEKNGCLWVLPRAHRGGILQHARGKGYLVIPDEELPAGAKAVCCPMRKGSVLLLTNMTPHASYANNTDMVRWSMDLRYQSAALPTNARITRLEGEAVAGSGDGSPPACYPPEADFLVRSRRRPQEVVTDAKVFQEIRTKHLAAPWRNRWTQTAGA